jgi:hypothetical protein
MDAADRPLRTPGVEIYAVEDGCVVFVPATDQVHFLNETAMHVLDLCDGRTDVDGLQAEFGDTGDVGFDVRTILEQFERAGIIASRGRVNA